MSGLRTFKVRGAGLALLVLIVASSAGAATPDGQLQLDSNHNLVTESGYKLVWQGQVPQTAVDLTVTAGGTVNAILADGTSTVAGTVQLARFANPTGLLENGNNTYLPSTSSGAAKMYAPGSPNTGTISSHSIETSNVDIGREMTTMTGDQRTFQMSLQAFQQTDNMIALAINLRK